MSESTIDVSSTWTQSLTHGHYIPLFSAKHQNLPLPLNFDIGPPDKALKGWFDAQPRPSRSTINLFLRIPNNASAGRRAFVLHR
jgi:hypothetical protein